MRKLIKIPHRICDFTCMISGIDDMYTWKTGKSLPLYFLFWASGMAGFTYLRIKIAKPPRMVFSGLNTPRQYKNLERILNIKFKKMENRTFEFTLSKIKSFIDKDVPVILGPLDMFYLSYLQFYQTTHIPIHYILAVGYDDNEEIFYIYDCGRKNKQTISYNYIKQALNVNVPGLGRKNTIHTIVWSEKIPDIKEIVRESLKIKINFMLNPPFSGIGIKAIEKLAKDILNWQYELSKRDFLDSLRHMVTYFATPPTFESKVVDGGRIKYAEQYIKVCGEVLGKDRIKHTEKLFKKSGKLFSEISKKIKDNFPDVTEEVIKIISDKLNQIARIEKESYEIIKNEI